MLCQKGIQAYQVVPAAEVMAYLSKGYYLLGQAFPLQGQAYQAVVRTDGMTINYEYLPTDLLKTISLNRVELKCLKLLLSDERLTQSAETVGRIPDVARKVVAELRAKFACKTTHGLVRKLCQLGFDSPDKIERLIQDTLK